MLGSGVCVPFACGYAQVRVHGRDARYVISMATRSCEHSADICAFHKRQHPLHLDAKLSPGSASEVSVRPHCGAEQCSPALTPAHERSLKPTVFDLKGSKGDKMLKSQGQRIHEACVHAQYGM